MRTEQQQSFSPAPVPPRRRWTPAKITILVIVVVLLGVAGGVGWKLLSPLFLHTTAHDSNPFANATPGATNPTGGGQSGPVILATGTFIDTGSGDHGSGTVAIGKTADGKYALFLDNLNVTNGPDLHVYLATAKNPDSSDQVTNGGVDLGTLKATEGSVNVDVPANVGGNLAQYKSVVIYCKSFNVIFTVAPLQFSA